MRSRPGRATVPAVGEETAIETTSQGDRERAWAETAAWVAEYHAARLRGDEAAMEKARAAVAPKIIVDEWYEGAARSVLKDPS